MQRGGKPKGILWMLIVMVSGFPTFPLPAFLHCAYGIWSGETRSQFCVQDDELNCRYGPNYWPWGGISPERCLCIFVPLAGVQKINHWSHKKGLPHVTWHRRGRIPEVQNPVCIHLLQGDETLEQCTQLPFLITANSSLMSHNEYICVLYLIMWHVALVFQWFLPGKRIIF